ncbi:MAG: helix-turn-helix transcriptional regulator, partial [Burkholderiales bacterium]|nr:helix-turn-helix transcriptional regulator [Burkholderiales bacterium]
LPALLAVTRASHAQARGDSANTIRFARHALALVADDDPLTHGIASGFLGIASWMNGDLESAYTALADGMTSLRRAGNVAFVLNDVFFQAEIRLAQGRLRAASAIYEQALRQSIVPDRPPAQGAANLYAGLSIVRLEQGDVAAAQDALRQSEALGEAAGLPDWPYRHNLATAQLRMARGQWNEALQLLAEAEEMYSGLPVPLWRPPAVLQARIWIAQGQLAKVRQWIGAQGLKVDDTLRYSHEAAHITLAHLLLAELRLAQNDGAVLIELLGRL